MVSILNVHITVKAVSKGRRDMVINITFNMWNTIFHYHNFVSYENLIKIKVNFTNIFNWKLFIWFTGGPPPRGFPPTSGPPPMSGPPTGPPMRFGGPPPPGHVSFSF